ncbi:MAG: cyclic nucleotide-binding domain-containing protein [Algiphilus sp.]
MTDHSTHYRIAIVGSGPGGLSAACRAAEMGDSHVLLEAKPNLSNTIFRYQKGKHVMAEPSILPLRAAAHFEAGTREAILDAWYRDVEERGVNIRYEAEVTAIQRDEAGIFHLSVKNGEAVSADAVVLGIGVQGNPRKLGAPGEDLPGIQYTLDDPDEYRGEVIVVVGAGDAAIENAVALARQNTVHIVNRKNEFSRAKEGNNNLILQAIDDGALTCHYDTTVDAIESLSPAHDSGRSMCLRLNSAEDQVEVHCDRIIARLGAIPPRAFVESCGVTFPNEDPASVPQVSSTYESNVSGLYVVGALAGYPLIKQAMNQGFEVVETICGRPVRPADEPILKERFAVFPWVDDVDVVLDVLSARSPIFSAMNRLQLREFLLESSIQGFAEDSVIYQQGDYGASVFVIVSGEAWVEFGAGDFSKRAKIKTGRIFGEMALISGRPRSATVRAGKDLLVVEVPRRAMLKLIASNEKVQRFVDRTFTMRALERYLAPGIDEHELSNVVAQAELQEFRAGEAIYEMGGTADHIYLIRSGSVTLSVPGAEEDVILNYVPGGNYFGELDVIAGTERQQTARAAIKTQTISVPAQPFLELLDHYPDIKESVRARFSEQIHRRLELERSPERGALMHFLLQEGMGEATDALLIDESLCVRCDYCEKACAATHGNVSRLDREAGATFNNLHVPTSCRHCEHPHCMKDCPPDAIHRSPNGEVYIEDTCIGCGNCERNCPYGVIQMGVASEEKPSLLKWLLTGMGPEPGAEIKGKSGGNSIKKAVKCDMCGDREEGPACVQACPTGAAIRVSPESFFQVLSRGGR